MKFYSTRDKAHVVSLQEAVLRGLAPNQGLYMPAELSPLPSQFFRDIKKLTFEETSLAVARQVLGSSLDAATLEAVVHHTVAFDAPLVRLEPDVFSLELYHGPTLAFKDFGARFLSGLLGHFARQEAREVVILAATSGDTGSAVANGFLGVAGTRVVILYPSGKVSDLQEKQFTTLGANVTALEVNGTFDDCQLLVKQAFADDQLSSQLFLTSANSINVGRLIPQMFYYFWAVSQLPRHHERVVVSVPSGNFGNLTAGIMAQRLGLPVHRFVAATNRNDVVPQYLAGGKFNPRPSISTLSNAMDVGNPSNVDRLFDLFEHDRNAIARVIKGASFSDEETAAAIRDVFHQYGYLLDPHGAVGYLGLKQTLQHGEAGIFLETAHPGKFREVVEASAGQTLVLPERLREFVLRQKQSLPMENSFDSLKRYLLDL